VATARALVTAPSCCSLTSRWPRSMSRPRPTSAACSARSWASPAPPTCWSPTTCSTPSRSATGWSSSRTARSCSPVHPPRW